MIQGRYGKSKTNTCGKKLKRIYTVSREIITVSSENLAIIKWQIVFEDIYSYKRKIVRMNYFKGHVF